MTANIADQKRIFCYCEEWRALETSKGISKFFWDKKSCAIVHWIKIIVKAEKERRPDITSTNIFFTHLSSHRPCGQRIKSMNIAQPQIISSDNFLINYFSDVFFEGQTKSLRNVLSVETAPCVLQPPSPVSSKVIVYNIIPSQLSSEAGKKRKKYQVHGNKNKI